MSYSEAIEPRALRGFREMTEEMSVRTEERIGW
jgi:hypothetical protein